MTDDESRAHFQRLADLAPDDRLRRYYLACLDEVGKPFVRHTDPMLRGYGDPYRPKNGNAHAWMRAFGYGTKRGG